MQAITQYKTNDGAIFDSAAAAKKHEKLVELVNKAVEPLGKPLASAINYKGWIQHDKKNVDKVKLTLLELARPLFNDWPKILETLDTNPLSIHPGSIVGRILDDADYPINNGWRRLWCIDSEYREHNQPYFAINGPDKGMKCVEDRSKG